MGRTCIRAVTKSRHDDQHSTLLSGRREDELSLEVRSIEAGSEDAWAHVLGDPRVHKPGTAADSDIFQMVEPFIVENAEVIEPVTDEEQVTLAAQCNEEMEYGGSKEESGAEGAACS